MPNLILDSIAIDCPDAHELAAFYAQLLGVAQRNDAIHVRDGNLEIWFQQVEGYQSPTWPTQERGQQVHLDFGVSDVDAAIERAVQLGAILTERREDYHYPILLDPVGHPFCLIEANDDSAKQIEVSALNFDSANASELAAFYQGLIGGTIDEFPEWMNLERENELNLSFQSVADYQPPTWPTQERGQQIHIDFHTDDREAEVNRAIQLGASLQVMEQGFTVLLDPAGHPFCICDVHG